MIEDDEFAGWHDAPLRSLDDRLRTAMVVGCGGLVLLMLACGGLGFAVARWVFG